MKPTGFPSDYRFVAYLGVGGMGIVSLVRERFFSRKYLKRKSKISKSWRLGLNRKQYALKTLLPHLAVHDVNFDRLEKEVDIGEDLDHPNIVKITGSSIHGKNYFIEMEYIKGRDLKYLLENCGPLPLFVALHIILEICKGLNYAHTEVKNWQGHPRVVIHKDLSPSNILISEFGEVKITDFGLAKVANESSISRDLEGAGKYGYTAPEVFLGDDKAHPRWDVFSCGIILHEMLTGHLPAGEYNVNRENHPVDEAGQKIPPEIAEAINAATKPKSERILTIDKFRSAIQKTYDSIGNENRYRVGDFIKDNAPAIGDLPDQKTLVEKVEKLDIPERFRPLWQTILFVVFIVLITLSGAALWPILFGPRLGDAFDYHIVYASTDGRKNSLWIINPDGSGRTRLHDFETGAEVGALQGSPIGDKIYMAYRSPAGPWNIASVDRKGRLRHVTPKTKTWENKLNAGENPLISPDGKWLTFAASMRNRNGWNEIFKIRTGHYPDPVRVESAILNGGREKGGEYEKVILEEKIHQLTKREEIDPEFPRVLMNYYAWAPDGKRLVMETAKQTPYASKLWVLDNNGKNLRMIHKNRIRCEALTWSEKDLITFTDGDRKDQNNIYVINPDGTGLRALVESPYNDFFFRQNRRTWAPAADWMLFESNRNGNYDLFLIDKWGNNLSQQTFDPKDERRGLYSPKHDGKYFYILDYSTLCVSAPGPQGSNKKISIPDETVLYYTFLPRQKK